MTDYSSFQRGGVQYPLTPSTANAPIVDADPAMNLAGNFLAGMLQIHLGARLAAEGGVVGLQFASAVGNILNVEPTPVFLATDMRWPVFGIYRKTTTFNELTAVWEQDISQWEFVYILPPMTPRQTERLEPMLRAAVVVIDHAITQGFDPAYMSGAKVWALAGIKRVRLVSVKHGPYEPLEATDRLFRAVSGIIEVEERDMPIAAAFDLFSGADIAVDNVSGQKTVVSDVADAATGPAPTLASLSVVSGTTAGGTTVTATGSGFVVGTTPKILVGSVVAAAVAVLSATQVRFVTPAHAAHPTFMADVTVINPDGQSATLPAAFTFV